MMKITTNRKKGQVIGLTVKDIYSEGHLEMFEAAVEGTGCEVVIKDMGGTKRQVLGNINQLNKFIDNWNK